MPPDIPRMAQGAAYPDVESTFGGYGAGKFAEHERGGKAPEKREEQKNNEGFAVARASENVFNAIGATGDHEVGGGNKRNKAHAASA